MFEITAEMKKRFLELQSGEEYDEFIREYPIPILDLVEDKDMEKKMIELIRMAPGSCGDGSGWHEEVRRRDRKTLAEQIAEMEKNKK